MARIRFMMNLHVLPDTSSSQHSAEESSDDGNHERYLREHHLPIPKTRSLPTPASWLTTFSTTSLGFRTKSQQFDLRLLPFSCKSRDRSGHVCDSVKRLSPKATPRERHANVAVNAQKVLTTLRLGSAEFNDNQTTPQFSGSYFGWIKQHSQAGHLVMIVAYAQGANDSDYDHLMLATGFTSTDSTTYQPSDHLYFNDNYSSTPVDRMASTLADARGMHGNGRTLRILSAFKHRLRLRDHRHSKSSYTHDTKFVATKATNFFSVGIPSNGVAIFRCLPAGK